jgi:hypothetical protein
MLEPSRERTLHLQAGGVLMAGPASDTAWASEIQPAQIQPERRGV